MPPLPPLPQLEPAGTESVLRAIFTDATDAIGVAHQTVIRAANPSMVRLFGFDREEELIGRSFLDLVAPESRESLQIESQKRSQGEAVPGRYRAWMLRRDGGRFEADITTTAFGQGDQQLTWALLREIGAAGQSVAELYQAIFERNSAVKLLIDPFDGRVVDANQAAADLYGWPVEVLRTMYLSEIDTLPPRELAVELEGALLGRRQDFRFRHRVASGEIIHVDVHSGAVEIAGRQLLLSIVQDVTEREALEEQLRQSQKLEAIGRLAGGIAHDFNNLLTVMMSCGDLLRPQLPLQSKGSKLLDDLMHAASRASALTEQLLAMAQRQHLHPQPVRLDLVIEGMDGLLARLLGPGIEIHLQLEPALVVEIDPGQLEQIVINLAINARDATRGRGRIEIAARRAEPPRGIDGPAVALSVRDDGGGMSEATRLRVFEPFFTTKPRGKGTGLGLASVYGIVTQSGGQVTVESALGQGSTFTVWLPLHESSTPAADPGPPACVLLVDDEPDVLGALGDSLERSGFRVISVGSGDEAVRLPDEVLTTVDLVVTDQVMPGRAGIEVARELIARKPGLRVILVSGDLMPGGERLPEGTIPLRKPFSGRELTRTIRSALEAER